MKSLKRYQTRELVNALVGCCVAAEMCLSDNGTPDHKPGDDPIGDLAVYLERFAAVRHEVGRRRLNVFSMDKVESCDLRIESARRRQDFYQRGVPMGFEVFTPVKGGRKAPTKLRLPPGLKPYYADENSGIYIIHGDCREVLPGLEDASIDLVLTDPPYGHNNNNNGDLIQRREAALGRGESGPPRAIVNDGVEANDLIRWSFSEWRRLLKPGCCCCCCGGGGGPDPQFARWSLWMDEVFDFKQMVVWDKGPMGMGWHYRRSYETVLVGTKPGAACQWFDTSGKVENIIRDIPKIIPKDTDHPTPKPEALMRRFILWHTLPGQIVLDPFCGAGPTLRAALDMERRAIGIEIEERYCEMAARRLAQGVLAFGGTHGR